MDQPSTASKRREWGVVVVVVVMIIMTMMMWREWGLPDARQTDGRQKGPAGGASSCL